MTTRRRQEITNEMYYMADWVFTTTLVGGSTLSPQVGVEE